MSAASPRDRTPAPAQRSREAPPGAPLHPGPRQGSPQALPRDSPQTPQQGSPQMPSPPPASRARRNLAQDMQEAATRRVLPLDEAP